MQRTLIHAYRAEVEEMQFEKVDIQKLLDAVKKQNGPSHNSCASRIFHYILWRLDVEQRSSFEGARRFRNDSDRSYDEITDSSESDKAEFED